MVNKGRRQDLKNGWEEDWVSRVWRRYYAWRSGQGKYIRRALNKRSRQDAKKEIQQDVSDQ